MKLSNRTLEKLRIIINGDDTSSYRKGYQLVSFFNELGFQDVYGQGFPSRWVYTDDRLQKINGTPELDKCIRKAFDQLLQSVYWAYELYTSASDRDGNTYTNEWDVKKIMTFCTYEFVVGELKKRGQTDVRKLLTACSGKIEEVRLWANYIKHKGGVDYKDSQAEDPFEIYIMPIGTTPESDKPDERFLIENFKSPVEIDIDEKSEVMSNVHSALYDCITKVIETIDYDSYKLQFGGTN